MRRRLRYFRLFGLMTIVLAIVVGIYFGAKRGGETQSTTETEPILKVTPRIVVAANDLMPRTLITPELLEEREVSSVPEGVFRRKDEAVHRLTTVLIRKGEPIFQQHVTPPLKEISAAYLIPPGQVGMALTISRPETLPPVRPGDYISVHAVFAGMKVRTIIPRAMVLAVNNKIGEISLSPQPQPSPQQQQQPPSPEKEMILFVALSPQEAKSVALAMDSGATFYYTLHSAPLPPLLPPGLERDLTLQELVGSPQVAAVIARKQHGELPKTQPESAQEPRQLSLPPVTLEPVTAQISRLDRSVQSLHQRVQKLEQQKPVQLPPIQNTSAKERRIVGVVGDQMVTFAVPQRHKMDGGER
ncbi:MAG: Flp pilus assembly protein CpaB [Armatimonadota bacterium]